MKKKDNIEDKLKKGIQEFLSGFGVTSVNFRDHTLKISKKQVVYKPKKK